jgi:hypothetical protein
MFPSFSGSNNRMGNKPALKQAVCSSEPLADFHGIIPKKIKLLIATVKNSNTGTPLSFWPKLGKLKDLKRTKRPVTRYEITRNSQATSRFSNKVYNS